jgi:hypothetical protein
MKDMLKEIQQKLHLARPINNPSLPRLTHSVLSVYIKHAVRVINEISACIFGRFFYYNRIFHVSNKSEDM